MTQFDPQRLDDMATQFGHLYATHDLDPIYPLTQGINNHLNLSRAQELWWIYIYVTCYNIATTYYIFHRWPGPETVRQDPDGFQQWHDDNLSAMLVGMERRHVGRQHKIAETLLDFVTKVDNIEKFHDDKLNFTAGGTPGSRWLDLHAAMCDFRNWGRWAAFKYCDMMNEVMGYMVKAPHMMLKHSSGPRQGLLTFLGWNEVRDDDAFIAKLDTIGEELLHILRDERGLSIDMQRLETLMCKWKSMVRGRYYVGHDIDEIQEHIQASEDATGEQYPLLWQIREETFDHRMLGEKNGWVGVRRDLARLYADNGVIFNGVGEEEPKKEEGWGSLWE